jgi:hypothetical protein
MTPFTLCDADELRGFFISAGFEKVDVFPESTKVRFPEPKRFAPLALMSTAWAVPAFTQLEAPARESLLETMSAEVEPTVRRFRDADSLTFPMFAHIARATA